MTVWRSQTPDTVSEISSSILKLATSRFVDASAESSATIEHWESIGEERDSTLSDEHRREYTMMAADILHRSQTTQHTLPILRYLRTTCVSTGAHRTKTVEWTLLQAR